MGVSIRGREGGEKRAVSMASGDVVASGGVDRTVTVTVMLIVVA